MNFSRLTIFIAIFVISFLTYSNESYAKEFYKIFNNGVLEKAITEEVYKEDKGDHYIVDIKEVDGISAKNNFKIDDESFYGKLEFENKVLFLEGSRNNEDYLTYSGVIDNDDEKNFDAVLVYEKNNNGKYILYLTVYNVEEAPMTFIFNDKKPQKKEIKDQKVEKVFQTQKDSPITLYSSTDREFLSGYEKKYLNSAIFGNSAILRGSYNNYTLRSTTNTSGITQYWKNAKWSVWGTKVETWKVKINGASTTEVEAKNPSQSGVTSFSVPAYLPAVGYQTFKITTNKTTVSGSGSRNLTVTLQWPNYSSAHEGDDVGYKEKPDGDPLAIDFALKTESDTPLGINTNSFTTELTYVSRAYNANTPNTYLAKTETITTTWLVNVKSKL